MKMFGSYVLKLGKYYLRASNGNKYNPSVPNVYGEITRWF